MAHLTWAGRRDVVWYAIRRILIKPVPDGERCIMGYHDEATYCSRRVENDGLWCRVHIKDAR